MAICYINAQLSRVSVMPPSVSSDAVFYGMVMEEVAIAFAQQICGPSLAQAKLKGGYQGAQLFVYRWTEAAQNWVLWYSAVV
jgi:hypothetical protein